MGDGDLAVDIAAGGRGLKGQKDPDGTVHACFSQIIVEHAPAEDRQALARLIAFIDAQDAHGSAVQHLAPGLDREAAEVLASSGINAVLRALQSRHPRNDALVCERMAEIFDGMLQAGRARARAEAEADRAEVLPGGKVAIVRDSREFATNGVLFERGVRVIVYVDGMNIGLIRHSDETLRMDALDFRGTIAVAGEHIGDDPGGWFAHPAGFLFCRGSRKAPATTPSRVDPRDLAEAARLLLG